MPSKQVENEAERIILKNLVLILAPHPDDEIFGLGGYMLKILDKGCKVSIIYLTDGEGSDVWHDREEIRKQRIALSENVCANLHINKSVTFRLHIPDGFVPHPGQSGFEEAVKSVKEIIDSVKPDAVFATHWLDYWPFDHVACADIAVEGIKKSISKPQLWYYWVWAWYNIRPQQIGSIKFKKLQMIEIRDQLKRKKELIDIYLNALTPDGKPWCGELPSLLIKAFKQPTEIIEKADLKN